MRPSVCFLTKESCRGCFLNDLFWCRCMLKSPRHHLGMSWGCPRMSTTQTCGNFFFSQKNWDKCLLLNFAKNQVLNDKIYSCMKKAYVIGVLVIQNLIFCSIEMLVTVSQSWWRYQIERIERRIQPNISVLDLMLSLWHRHFDVLVFCQLTQVRHQRPRWPEVRLPIEPADTLTTNYSNIWLHIRGLFLANFHVPILIWPIFVILVTK